MRVARTHSTYATSPPSLPPMHLEPHFPLSRLRAGPAQLHSITQTPAAAGTQATRTHAPDARARARGAVIYQRSTVRARGSRAWTRWWTHCELGGGRTWTGLWCAQRQLSCIYLCACPALNMNGISGGRNISGDALRIERPQRPTGGAVCNESARSLRDCAPCVVQLRGWYMLCYHHLCICAYMRT